MKIYFNCNAQKSDFSFEEDTEFMVDIDEPDLFTVYLLNDDYTPMDFVVDILEKVFSKSSTEATQIMLDIHNKGKCACGVYPYDIAEMKVNLVKQMAKSSSFPLRSVIEKE